MGDTDGADAWRQLRRMSAVAAGFRGARQAMVPGQPAASGGASGAPLELGLAASSAHRYRRVSHRAAVVDLSRARNPDILAGAVCPARVFPQRIFTVSELAGSGPGARRMGFPRHDGIAAAAETARRCAAFDASGKPKAVPRGFWSLDRDPGRNLAIRPDRAGDDDLSIHRGGGDSDRTRRRLAGAAAWRWRGAAPRDHW